MIDPLVVSRAQVPRALVENLKVAGEALRGPQYRETLRQIIENVCFPTDDQERKGRIKNIMSSAPRYVMSSPFDQHILLWDGAAAAAGCKMPALYIGAATSLSDDDRLRQLCPQQWLGRLWVRATSIITEVPEQVNAMIDRFLTLAANQISTI